MINTYWFLKGVLYIFDALCNLLLIIDKNWFISSFSWFQRKVEFELEELKKHPALRVVLRDLKLCSFDLGNSLPIIDVSKVNTEPQLDEAGNLQVSEPYNHLWFLVMISLFHIDLSLTGLNK